MTQLTKGANLTVPAERVRASLSWTGSPGVPDVDASALLLGADGVVSSDADFVFYNQPAHASGSVRHAGKSVGAQCRDVIDVDLAAVPAAVERIVLAASSDGGTFGQVPGLQLLISDLTTNAVVAMFPISATDETALVGGELYRRAGTWKFRAVGQGYASGLAGLAGDFGIAIEGPPAPDPPAPGAPGPSGAQPGAGQPPPGRPPAAAGPADLLGTGPGPGRPPSPPAGPADLLGPFGR